MGDGSNPSGRNEAWLSILRGADEDSLADHHETGTGSGGARGHGQNRDPVGRAWGRRGRLSPGGGRLRSGAGGNPWIRYSGPREFLLRPKAR